VAEKNTNWKHTKKVSGSFLITHYTTICRPINHQAYIMKAEILSWIHRWGVGCDAPMMKYQIIIIIIESVVPLGT
jgi:hypothetical protein